MSDVTKDIKKDKKKVKGEEKFFDLGKRFFRFFIGK